ncbi:hypothetical protein C8R45DRAFT_939996 [Mycena sanguinolenta]|nr:hypothetical protein C8R45DRAFT_939996 [Mycena sanguinolenta]
MSFHLLEGTPLSIQAPGIFFGADPFWSLGSNTGAIPFKQVMWSTDITAKLHVQGGSVIRPPEQEPALAVRYDCQSACASARCDPTAKVEAQGGDPTTKAERKCAVRSDSQSRSARWWSDPTAKVQVQGGGQIRQPRLRESARCDPTAKVEAQGDSQIRQPRSRESARCDPTASVKREWARCDPTAITFVIQPAAPLYSAKPYVIVQPGICDLGPQTKSEISQGP